MAEVWWKWHAASQSRDLVLDAAELDVLVDENASIDGRVLSIISGRDRRCQGQNEQVEKLHTDREMGELSFGQTGCLPRRREGTFIVLSQSILSHPCFPKCLIHAIAKCLDPFSDYTVSARSAPRFRQFVAELHPTQPRP